MCVGANGLSLNGYWILGTCGRNLHVESGVRMLSVELGF